MLISLCSFGLHNWDKWVARYTRKFVGSIEGAGRRQSRTCQRCGLIEDKNIL